MLLATEKRARDSAPHPKYSTLQRLRCQFRSPKHLHVAPLYPNQPAAGGLGNLREQALASPRGGSREGKKIARVKAAEAHIPSPSSPLVYTRNAFANTPSFRTCTLHCFAAVGGKQAESAAESFTQRSRSAVCTQRASLKQLGKGGLQGGAMDRSQEMARCFWKPPGWPLPPPLSETPAHVGPIPGGRRRKAAPFGRPGC